MKKKFAFDDSLLNFLFMNGVIGTEKSENSLYVKFPSPFVQKRLFNYFARELFDETVKLYEPFENLSDTVTETSLNIRNLMRRFEIHLKKTGNGCSETRQDAGICGYLRPCLILFCTGIYLIFWEPSAHGSGRSFPQATEKLTFLSAMQTACTRLNSKHTQMSMDTEKPLHRPHIKENSSDLRKFLLSFLWNTLMMPTGKNMKKITGMSKAA